uniref:FTH domain-containing protein n=2 Tax=Caenorhabditis tropicalis TaxID=1561998 RepID=A0A1I7V2X5_9PELO
MPAEPIWRDLPFRFKQSVVDKLDFRSRLSLQKCSRQDQILVNSVPCFLSSLLLNLSPDIYDSDVSDDESESSAPEPSKTELLVMEKPFSKGLYWKTENEDCTIEILNSIFQKPKYRFWDLILSKDGNPSRFIDLLLTKIDENQKFHVHKLTWTCIEIAKTAEELKTCLKFFDLFDAATLRTIEINFSHKVLIEEMMMMDQFMNLKEIFINSEIESEQLEHLFHAKRFKVRLREVISEDLKRVIEVFLTKNQGSYFKISTDENQIDLDKLLETFQSMPNNSSVPTDSFYERDTNTHRFEIRDHKSENGEQLVLYMKIRRNDIWGVVCRVNHIIQDFSLCPYY